MEQLNFSLGLQRIREKYGIPATKTLTTVKGKNRIFVTKDLSGDEYLVPSWISQKGNLCWKLGEVLYVKMPNGHTSMLKDGKWQRADSHTKAKAPTPEPETKPDVAAMRRDAEQLVFA